MKTSQKGIDLIKKSEDCKLTAYRLAGEKYFSIGYGHSSDPSITASTVWTHAQAEAALRVDLQKFERYVEKYVPFPLTQGQFDALVSYTYNRGLGGLRQLVQQSRKIEDYPDNIVKYWGTAVKYKAGLIRRREAERELFLSDTGKDIDTIAREVIDGQWGNGTERRSRLTAAWYDYEAVRKRVNEMVKGSKNV